MRTVALLALVAFSSQLVAGCNAQIQTGRIDPTPSPFDPGFGMAGNDGGEEDPGQGGNDGGGGMSCPPGSHASGGRCVADEITCATEFPCPDGQQCVGGRCVGVPGPCTTNDDCPVGDTCVNGVCKPLCPQGAQCTKDADCGADSFCVACMCKKADQCQKPTPDLSGLPWAANQNLHLDEALGAFGQVFAGIMKDLRDGILGCPKGSGANCWIFQLIGATLPKYVQTLIVALGNFADILDNHNFLVQSQMTFTKSAKPSSYNGIDHWTLLTFSYMNMVVSKKPEDVQQIGKPLFIPFTASAVCGVLYVDKHKVEGVLSGILRWIIDTVIQLQTCGKGGPCYKTLGDLIDGSIDCNQFLNNIPVFAACTAFKKGLSQKLNDAIDQWLLDYSLMTLKGTAQVDPNGRALTQGHWDGTIGNGIGIFKNFNGEWSAKR